jgi:hypothetical protein
VFFCENRNPRAQSCERTARLGAHPPKLIRTAAALVLGGQETIVIRTYHNSFRAARRCLGAGQEAGRIGWRGFLRIVRTSAGSCSEAGNRSALSDLAVASQGPVPGKGRFRRRMRRVRSESERRQTPERDAAHFHFHPHFHFSFHPAVTEGGRRRNLPPPSDLRPRANSACSVGRGAAGRRSGLSRFWRPAATPG